MNVFILRHSPYNSSLAREALDMALAFAAFDEDVALVFMGDGIYQLIDNQNTQAQGVKNIAKTLDSLALFDIEKIYVCEQSLLARLPNAEQLKPLATMITATELHSLIQSSQQVFNF